MGKKAIATIIGKGNSKKEERLPTERKTLERE